MHLQSQSERIATLLKSVAASNLRLPRPRLNFGLNHLFWTMYALAILMGALIGFRRP